MEALLKDLPPDSQVDIITTLPNRYSTFVTEAPEHENRGPVQITRLKLPPHQSGMLDQSRAFLQFARGARNIALGRSYDVVFATSSRLMTAALGAWIAARVGAR